MQFRFSWMVDVHIKHGPSVKIMTLSNPSETKAQSSALNASFLDSM